MGLGVNIKTSSAKAAVRAALPSLALLLEMDAVVQVQDIVLTAHLGDTSTVASAWVALSAGTKQLKTQQQAKLAMQASTRHKSSRHSALCVREVSTLGQLRR
jgi:hypothetical protein